jgi:hypothetical protein
VKCPSCMIGKATVKDIPKARQFKVNPLHQINVDSSSSSVTSIDRYNMYKHAVVFVVSVPGKMNLLNEDYAQIGGSNARKCR